MRVVEVYGITFVGLGGDYQSTVAVIFRKGATDVGKNGAGALGLVDNLPTTRLHQ